MVRYWFHPVCAHTADLMNYRFKSTTRYLTSAISCISTGHSLSFLSVFNKDEDNSDDSLLILWITMVLSEVYGKYLNETHVVKSK